MSEWQVLLLGGSTAAGKSTSGALVARQLGVACVSADSVWKALEAATTRETHPAFHHFEPPPEVIGSRPRPPAGAAHRGGAGNYGRAGGVHRLGGARRTPVPVRRRLGRPSWRRGSVGSRSVHALCSSTNRWRRKCWPPCSAERPHGATPSAIDDLRDGLAIRELAAGADAAARATDRRGAAQGDACGANTQGDGMAGQTTSVAG